MSVYKGSNSWQTPQRQNLIRDEKAVRICILLCGLAQRKDGEKNENMTLCLSLALVTKKERFSMSKTKPNQKKKKKKE